MIDRSRVWISGLDGSKKGRRGECVRERNAKGHLEGKERRCSLLSGKFLMDGGKGVEAVQKKQVQGKVWCVSVLSVGVGVWEAGDWTGQYR